MKTANRDQTPARKALEQLKILKARYPDSEYAQDADNKIRICLDNLAANEMEVGRYYLDHHNYVGAINRFKTVVSDYQTTAHVEEALARLVECYMALGITKEAQNAAAILGHNYPDSKWYKDSYALLESGGLGAPGGQRFLAIQGLELRSQAFSAVYAFHANYALDAENHHAELGHRKRLISSDFLQELALC